MEPAHDAPLSHRERIADGVVVEPARKDGAHHDVGQRTVDVILRTGFARRFHNDAVRDALVVRRRRIVRWFRLAGTARLPSFFEMDEPVLDRRTIEV